MSDKIFCSQIIIDESDRTYIGQGILICALTRLCICLDIVNVLKFGHFENKFKTYYQSLK